MKSLKKLLPNGEAISARTPLLLLSSSLSPQLPALPPSVSAVPWEFGRVKQDLLGGRLVLAWSVLPWIGGDCSDLHACMKVAPRVGDPSLHAQTTYTAALTGSIQDLLLGGNVSQEKYWGGCRCRPQGAGWGPGSGTQNGSGASGHLLSETQIKDIFNPKHERYN